MNIIEKAVEKILREKSNADSASEVPVARDVPSAEAEITSPDPQRNEASLVERSVMGDPDTGPAAATRRVAQTSEPAAMSQTPPVTKAEPADNQAGARPNDSPFIAISQLTREGVLTPDAERSRSAEEYRMIKRPLLTRAFQGAGKATAHSNLIMLTSSVEGEGKTFTSLNLAISIAMEMDRTVLLVDADLAKPGLSRLLGVNGRPGLTDRIIREDADLRDLLIPTDVPKLTVLPAGRRHKRSTELLASNNMRALLDELALRYSDRVVIFDSPPLLATSEASVLAEQMGQICLVVESAVTPQYLVKDALGQLASTDNVSLVLNKCKPDLFLGGYGYGYGYRYGYGYGYGYGQSDS